MSQTNETLKDDSLKLNKQIAELRNICKDQTNSIAEQHAFESILSITINKLHIIKL